MGRGRGGEGEEVSERGRSGERGGGEGGGSPASHTEG